jgi:hypothetical protein
LKSHFRALAKRFKIAMSNEKQAILH